MRPLLLPCRPGRPHCPCVLSALQFLTLCAQARPRATPDGDLLNLMELLCRAGLDMQLRLLPNADLQQLLLLLLQNIQEWPGKVRSPGPAPTPSFRMPPGALHMPQRGMACSEIMRS